MKQRLIWAKKPIETLSIRQRCTALDVPRCQLYYAACPKTASCDDATLMNEITDIYAKRPFQGYKRVTQDLKDLGYAVNHKRVYRLKSYLGLRTIYPKMNLSKRRQEDAVFPYLLRDQPPVKPHDCWAVDITYIKMNKGFVYLTAIIDVVSRCVMGFSLSPTLETESCIRAF